MLVVAVVCSFKKLKKLVEERENERAEKLKSSKLSHLCTPDQSLHEVGVLDRLLVLESLINCWMQPPLGLMFESCQGGRFQMLFGDPKSSLFEAHWLPQAGRGLCRPRGKNWETDLLCYFSKLYRSNYILASWKVSRAEDPTMGMGYYQTGNYKIGQ